jgi:hypothetical protein
LIGVRKRFENRGKLIGNCWEGVGKEFGNGRKLFGLCPISVGIVTNPVRKVIGFTHEKRHYLAFARKWAGTNGFERKPADVAPGAGEFR